MLLFLAVYDVSFDSGFHFAECSSCSNGREISICVTAHPPLTVFYCSRGTAGLSLLPIWNVSYLSEWVEEMSEKENPRRQSLTWWNLPTMPCSVLAPRTPNVLETVLLNSKQPLNSYVTCVRRRKTLSFSSRKSLKNQSSDGYINRCITLLRTPKPFKKLYSSAPNLNEKVNNYYQLLIFIFK